MSQPDNTTVEKGGRIKVKQGERGLEFYGYNHQRRRMLHIGTLIGQVYEKATAILENPEPSISLPQSEFGAALDHGAVYLRAIPSDKRGTYSISLADFQSLAIPYYNDRYGPQLRCPLTAFQSSAAVVKRNVITDNPSQARAEMILPRQLPLFGGRQ